MKNYRQPEFMDGVRQVRVAELARYYGKVDGLLEEKVRGNGGRYPTPVGSNKRSPAAMWLSCPEADRIIEEAGLVNPLFEDKKKLREF